MPDICKYRNVLKANNSIMIHLNSIMLGETRKGMESEVTEILSELDNIEMVLIIAHSKGKALRYIDNPSYLVQYYAKELGYEKYIKTPKIEELIWTDDSKALALSQGIFHDYDNYSNEVLIKAIKFNPDLINKINYLPKRIRMDVIELNPKWIALINDPSVELMGKAVSLDVDCFFDIANPPISILSNHNDCGDDYNYDNNDNHDYHKNHEDYDTYDNDESNLEEMVKEIEWERESYEPFSDGYFSDDY